MEHTIDSQIIRSPRRTLSLEITKEARLIIRAPIRISQQAIDRIIEKKRDWIIKKQQEIKARVPVVKYQYTVGEEFWYLGTKYPLKLNASWQKPFEFNGREFLIGEEFLPYAKRFLHDWYRLQASEVIGSRVKIYADKAGQSHSKVTITNAKTRWGSCTSKRTLNFNWRLIMAPLEMMDYVVAHEVAHLQELNHSPRFWARVKDLMPDYRSRQQWFKNNSYLLGIL